MENLCLFALGENFDVDAFLTSSSIVPSRIWRHGQPKKSGNQANLAACYPSSGIVFDLDEGEPLFIWQQEDIAMSFIKANRDELNRLGHYPGITHFSLALQYTRRVEPGEVGFTIGPSQWLMWHLLDIGGKPTYYVWLDCIESGANT